ncbi:hypothetical protein ACFE04_005401 [Oxalis oulophora]
MTTAKTLTLSSVDLYSSAVNHHPPPLSPLPSSLPPSNLIPKTRFVIDFFRLLSDHNTPFSFSFSFFLSHFHSDHYSGISSNWSRGIIFCSQITANLLIDILHVSSQFVFALPLGETVVIDGSEVTLIDANHCPGAVQFLFKVIDDDQFNKYVHTGDFRFCDEMKYDKLLSEFVNCDAVFLDTTYCHPKFIFPAQQESVDYIVSIIEKVGRNDVGSKKSVLFLVATYVIGKEKILVEIARRCGRKVYVDAKKMAVLRVLGMEEGIFTEDENESDVHVVGWNVLGETWPYFRPNFLKMKEIMEEKGYEKVIGFVPTGWTYEVKRNKFAVRTKDEFEIHLVPYSEHSNYDELREYVGFLKPKKVIPTVGVDVEKSESKHARKMQKYFTGLVDEMANKKEFLKGFYRDSNKKAENNDVNVVLDDSSIVQEPCSRDSVLLNDEETEKIIGELRDCLPTWVTRDLMLDLISNFGKNTVDAISSFYERETEFHEQVIGCTSSDSVSQISSINVLISPSKSVPVVSGSPAIPVFPLKKYHKPADSKPFNKSSVSPGKKKRNTTTNKTNKKAKTNSKPESSGSKQPTIMSFFNKLSPNVSQAEKCTENENLLPPQSSEPYGEKIDQFIKITNGAQSSRYYIASILEKTKGDINMALDMYYCNPEGNLGECVEKLAVPSTSAQAQSCTIRSSAGQDKIVLEKAKNTVDLSVQGLVTENVNVKFVALPPEKYNPVEHACWPVGQAAPYIHLARTFELVEAEKGKIKATSMLCNMFRSLLVLSPEDVLPAVYLCTHKIAADHENMDYVFLWRITNSLKMAQELNIGGSLVTSALEEACGTSKTKIRDMYNKCGDLGDVAQQCRQTQKLLAPPPPLLIRHVFSSLRRISMHQCTNRQWKYYQKENLDHKSHAVLQRERDEVYCQNSGKVRNLRIGAMMKTVLPALAQAVAMNSALDPKKDAPENLKEKLQSLSTAVVEAYNILPNLDMVVPSLIDNGIDFSSTTLSMLPGIPIKPMLAKVTNGVPQVLKLFQSRAFTCEYKYDGQRAQIHKLEDGSVRVFSRNGDETTSKFPDLVNTIKEICNPDTATFILDAEIVAIDRKDNCRLMSFQELSSRERGSKDSFVTLDSIKVDICIFVFDVMFANGEKLLGLPLRERRKYLKDLLNDEKSGYFEYAKQMTVEAEDSCSNNNDTLASISSFLEDAIKSSCEGIMVKALDVDAEYFPSKRADSWLKVKRDYVDGMNDSLDLVPIGAWYGNGRKAGWYSPFLMACYNPETEEYQSVCRVMSGFSDSFYIEMKEFFSEDKILSKKPPYYQTAEVPDMWFSPELVWEIRGADFTVSPVHQAALGMVHPSRGISIRFPRFIRSVSDRNPEECSTAADIAEMFHSQTRKMDVSQHE